MNLNEIPKKEMVNLLYTGSSRLQTMNSIRCELERVKEKYLPTEGGYKETWHGIHPIGKKLLLLLVGAYLVMLSENFMRETVVVLYDFFGLSESMILLIWNMFQFILLTLCLALAQLIVNKRIINWNRKHADVLEQNKAYNKRVALEEKSVQEKLMQETTKYAQISHMLPMDYKYNQKALREIARILENDRAECVGDAINLYREDLHRRHIEEQMEEANRLAQEEIEAIMENTRTKAQEVHHYYYY